MYAVNVQRHVGNNLAWLEVMRRETLSTRYHPYITSAKGLGRWVGLEKGIFADVQYCMLT